MASERTEKATPKRRSEARNKGQIAKSQDFNSAVMLSASIALLAIYSPKILTKIKYAATDTLSHLDPNKITNDNFSGYFTPYIALLMDLILPILLILLAVGVFINFVQIGPLFSMETIKPKGDKLTPIGMIKGFQKFFNMKSLVELVKSFAKMIIIGAVIFSVIMSFKDAILSSLGAEMILSLNLMSSIIFKMATQICAVLLVLGILDKKYQAFEFEKTIKMTKTEIKDEAKNSQGDPQIKSKIKSIQMQYAMQRMMSEIPSADVIVTNPTHYAVALRYDVKKAPAPQVVAKGVDFVAFKIREIAKNNNIPIIENKPLARTLYKIVPLEGLIPADLYVAVAEVLAFVYKTNKGKIR